jgi:uncharacterized membrane protein SirB2
MTFMADYYTQIKLVHIVCVVLSGSLFSLRGVLMFGGSVYANHSMVSRLSYVIDTTLLAAAVLLTIIIHQYPFVQAWLTAKVLLLVLYVVLGILALRRGKTRASRTAFFAAALITYSFIISVAVLHDPRGFLLFV